jgi:hypothetical protein
MATAELGPLIGDLIDALDGLAAFGMAPGNAAPTVGQHARRSGCRFGRKHVQPNGTQRPTHAQSRNARHDQRRPRRDDTYPANRRKRRQPAVLTLSGGYSPRQNCTCP